MKKMLRLPVNLQNKTNFFFARKVFSFLLFITCLLATTDSFSQVTGDYGSIATGNWNGTTTWGIYNGTTFVATATTPSSSNNVFIQGGFTVTITATGAVCNNLTIASASTLSFAATANVTLVASGTITSTAGAIGFAGSSSSVAGRFLQFNGTSCSLTGTTTWTQSSTSSSTAFDNGLHYGGSGTATLTATPSIGVITMAGTGTLQLGGNVTALSSNSNSGALANLTVSSGTFFPNGHTLTASGGNKNINLTGTGTLIIDASTYAGSYPSFISTSSTTFASTSTVEYTNSAPTVLAFSSAYGNLTIGNSTTATAVTAAAGISVAGILTVAANSSFAPAASTVTMSTAASGIVNNGTLTFSSLTVSTTPTAQSQYSTSFAIAATLTISSGVTLSPTSGTISMNSGWKLTNSGTLLSFFNITIVGTPGTQPSSTGNFSVKGLLSIPSGVTFTPTNTITMAANGSGISGGGTVLLSTLTISTPNNGDVVSITNSPITSAAIAFGNGNATGTINLTKGILKIGTGNAIFLTKNYVINRTSPSDFANSADASGLNADADGGTIAIGDQNGDVESINGGPTFYNLASNILTGTGNTTVAFATTTGVNARVNGTFTTGSSSSFTVTGNSIIWGPNSTLYIVGGGQWNYTKIAPLWNVSSGTIGSTPGYPNNVIITNDNNVAGLITLNLAANGVVSIGDGTSTGNLLSFSSGVTFSCGGFVINANSNVILPNTNMIVKGKFIIRSASGVTFNNNTSTVTLSGSGTSSIPDSVELATGTFYNLSLTGANAYAKLYSPVTVSNVFTLPTATNTPILETDATNILTISNPLSSGLVGGYASSYINGPAIWQMGTGSTGTYTMPLGAGASGANYYPFAFVSGSTTGTMQAQAIASAPGTADGTTLTSTSTTEYWKLITTGSFVASSFSIGRSTPALGGINAIGKSTSNGSTSYSSIAGSVTTLSGQPSVNTSTSGLSGASTLYLALATKIVIYTSTSNGDWNTPGIWSTGTVPPAGAPVVINTIVTANSTFSGGTPATITINNGASLTTGVAQSVAAVTVASGGTLAVGGGTLTASGAVSISGNFQLNGSGYATGGTWNYNGVGTLIYNSGGLYGTNSGDAYWPSTNGPVNVTVNTGSGAQLGNTASLSRTVTGIVTLNGQFDIQGGSALTASGTVQINAGGYFSSNSPTYSGSSSTLIYNTNSGYTTGLEWNGGATTSVAVGSAVPENVTIEGTGTNVSLNGGEGVPGTVTVNSGNTITLNASAGDLYIGTNFVMNGSLVNNTRAVFFVTTTAGSISSTNSNVTFDYLIINKAGSTLTLNKPIQINQIVTLTAGNIVTTSSNSLTLLNTGTGAITGGSTSSFVNGPLVWTMPTLIGSTGYAYPIGTGSTYLPMVVSPTISSGSILTATAISGGPASGTSGTGVGTLSSSEYWSLVSGSAFITSTIGLTQQASLGSNIVIGENTSVAGAYNSIGGIVSGTGITSTTATSSSASQYFVFATGPLPPTVTTKPATLITTTSATLNSLIATNGAVTTDSLDWGTSATPYSTFGLIGIASPLASGTLPDSAYITGLTPNTQYNFRASANNSGGSTNGSNVTFNTLSVAPAAAAASAIGANGFTANWAAPSPAGSLTYTYTVQVSTDPTFATVTTSQSSIASGTHTATFTGLGSATPYYYRVAALNPASSVWSSVIGPVVTTFTAGTACSSGASTTAGTSTGVIPAIIPDGTPASSTDPIWSNASAFLLPHEYNIASGKVPTAGGTTWQALFDSTNLYVLVTVRDSTLNGTSTGTSYQYDGTDTYIDGANGKQGSMNVSGKVASQTLFNYGSTTPVAGTNTITTATDVVTSITKGYTMFETIPWANVANMQNLSSTKITAASQIGFDVDYEDDQTTGTRSLSMAWMQTTNSQYNTPSAWGYAQLTVCAPPKVISPLATVIGSTSVTLGATVSALNGAGKFVSGGFGIEYSTSSGLASPTLVSSTGLPTINSAYSSSISGLSPQTKYYFAGYATRSIFGTNLTGVTSTANFYTLSNPPTAQAAFGTTTGITCNQAVLNWSTATFPGSGANNNGYILIRSTGTATTAGVTNGIAPASLTLTGGTLVTTITSGSTLTYTDAAISTGNTYNYILVPFTWDGTNAGTYNYLTTSASTTSVTPVTTGTPTSVASPASVCFGSSSTIAGTGGANAASWTFWTAGTGGTQLTGTSSTAVVSGNTLTTPTSLAAGTYTYYVEGENGTGCASATREMLTVTVSATAAGGTATAMPGAICSGSTSTLTLTGSSGTIQWQQSIDNINWTPISGATSTTYTTPALTTGVYYEALLTSGVCPVLSSVSDTVTVDQSSTASGTGWSDTYNDNTTGLGAWSLTTDLSGGGGAGFVNTATASNANPTPFVTPSIDQNGQSWGEYAYSGGVANAIRPLTSFAIGNTITYSMQNGYINSGNTVGFSLYNSSGAALMEFYFVGGGSTYTLNDATGVHSSGINYTNAGLTVSVAYTGSNTYGIEVKPLAGGATYYATGTFISTGNQIPANLRFFNANAGGSTNIDHNQYFNSLSLNRPVIVTPPTTTPITSCGVGASPTNLTVAAYGTGITYQWYSNASASNSGGTPVSGATSASLTPPSATGTVYYYCVINGTCSSDTSAVSGAISVQATTLWSGTNTNWNDATNWSCAVVPTTVTNVEIPTTPTGGNYPTLTASSSVHNLTLDASSTLGLGGNTFTITGALTGTGKLQGSSTSSLIIDSVAALNFAQTPDTLLNLTLGNNATATLGSALTIAAGANTAPGQLTIDSNAVLNTGNQLTLLSNKYSTAMVASIPENSGTGAALGTISGTVTVQRFVHSDVNTPTYPENGVGNNSIDNGLRAWRLLTAPVTESGSPTIQQAWQNSGIAYNAGISATQGIGTIVTGPSASNGLDAVSGVSLYSWTSGASQGFYAMSSTLGSISNGNYGGSNGGNTGYMIFIRGDRNPATVLNPEMGWDIPIVNTMLNPTGNLMTGRQVYNVVPSTGYSSGLNYTLIGNPYASPIDLSTLTTNNVRPTFYVWNPNLNTVGGFVTVDLTEGVNVSVPNKGANQYIQSGQAFFALGDIGTGTTTLTFDENNKVDSNNNYVFRPAGVTPSFSSNLYLLDSTATLADGNLAQYNNAFSAAVDNLDIPKLTNQGENFALLRDGVKLSIERRPIITNADTLFFSLTQTSSRNYQFQFTATGLSQPGLQGFLKDSFTGDSTVLNLDGTTTVNFSDTASGSQASNRFMVVFQNVGVVLPVTFTDITATQQNGNNVVVNWDVTNEVNIKSYEVERSTDNKTYTTIGTVTADGLGHYSLLDGKAVDGVNYYRILSTGNNGAMQYSRIVKVAIGTESPLITVFPNPVQDGQIGIQFTNMPAGVYVVNLMTTLGQELATKTISHQGGSATQTLPFNKALAKGVYQLEIINPDNTKTSLNLAY